MRYIREVLQHIEVEAAEVGGSGVHHRVQTIPWGNRLLSDMSILK